MLNRGFLTAFALVVLVGGCNSGKSDTASSSSPSSADNPGTNPTSSETGSTTPDKGPTTTGSDQAASKISVGFNLGPFKSYAPEIAFVDVFKQARAWIPSTVGNFSEWDSGVTVPVRADGYPTQIPFSSSKGQQEVKTQLLDSFGGHFPVGDYTLFFDGAGEIKLDQDAGKHTVTQSGEKIGIDPKNDTQNDGILLTITKSDAANPIHNIRMIMPGFEGKYEKEPINPDFVKNVAGAKVIRFMDFMEANNYPCDDRSIQTKDGKCVVGWKNRITPEFTPQTSDRGIAVEHIIAIANATKADPWVTLPHPADDDYVRNFAKVVKEKLDPNRKIYVEYSNEVWNGGFYQQEYTVNKGLEQKLDPDQYEGQRKFVAKRSAEIFKIFEDVLGNDRVINVVPAQAGNAYIGKKILQNLDDPALNPSAVKAEALAIAPYFGYKIADDIVKNGEVGSITVDEILNRAEKAVEDESKAWTVANKEFADLHGIPLVAYEGGPHLVANASQGRDDAKLTDKLVQANRNQRMYDIYQKMLRTWYGAGGDLFVVYHLTGVPTKYGSWGVLEYPTQSPQDAPKFRAIIDLMKKGL